MNRYVSAAVFVAVLAPLAALAIYARDFPHFGRMLDDGIYFATAKSMAVGRGYRIENLPEQPYQTKYPPLYPLLLSAAWRLDPRFPQNAPYALFLTWLSVPVYLFLLQRLFARFRFSPGEQWLLAIMCLGFAALPEVGICLLSDLWFSAIVLAALLTAEIRPESGQPEWRLGLAAGLLAACAYLTRTAGLALIASVPLVFLLQRKRTRAAAFCAVAVPAALAWMVWASLHTGPVLHYNDAFYTSYSGPQMPWREHLPYLPGRALTALAELGSAVVPEFLSYFLGMEPGPGLVWPARLAALAAMAGAVWISRKTGASHYLWFSLFYLGELLLWPWIGLGRLYIPLAPLVAIGFLALLRWLARDGLRWKPRAMRAAALMLYLVFGWIYVLQCVRAARIVDSHRTATEPFLRAYQWISANTPADASFVAFRDANLYLYTGRRAEGYHTPVWDESSDVKVGDFACQRGRGYILVGVDDFSFQTKPRMTEEIVRNLDGDQRFQAVYRRDGVNIYAVCRDDRRK